MPRSAVHGCELPGLGPHRSLAALPWAPRRRAAGGRIGVFAPHRAPWAASLSVKLGPPDRLVCRAAAVARNVTLAQRVCGSGQEGV
jgi:hypothetical protein